MRQRTRELIRTLLTVAATLAVAFVVVQGFIVRPAIRDREAARVEQALDAAERMGRGEGMRYVEGAMGVDLRMLRVDGDGSGPPPGLLPWTRVDTPRGAVWKREGGEWDIAAWTGAAWVVLHEDIAYAPMFGLLLLVGSAPVVILSLGFSRRAARPLEEAEAALARMAAGHLDERLDDAAGSRELRRVAGSVNQLAENLQVLLASERQRMAGLSHELRTPLTRIRLELELARREGGDAERLGRVESEIEGFDAMLTEMLELSRLELGGERLLRREAVDLVGLAQLVLEEEALTEVEIIGAGVADVDPKLAARLLANLLRNSRVHAPGARRWVRVDGGAVEVGDDGPGIPLAEQGRALEAFNRSQGSSGHGLGLAIVREIAELHGAVIALSEPPGLVVRVVFPPR